jgi:hypothetical protein
MALLFECMQSCARIVLDTADIVRDADITPVDDCGRRMRSGVASRKALLLLAF